jgi:HAD superfamily hydrolase (TIGR01484 family)
MAKVQLRVVVNNNVEMNPSKKIVFCDLDNTLLYENSCSETAYIKIEDKKQAGKFISCEVLNMIQEFRDKGHLFIINTGRSLDTYKYVEDLFICDYIILEHGGVVVRHGEIDKEWLQIHSDCISDYNSKSGRLWELMNHLMENGYKIHSTGRDASFRILSTNDEQIIQNENTSFLLKMQPYLDEFRVKLLRNGRYWDVIPESAGKENAAIHIVNSNDVLSDEIIAIGDDYNDLDLLNFASVSICPANSQKGIIDIVKQKGGFIPHSKGLKGSVEMLKFALK